MMTDRDRPRARPAPAGPDPMASRRGLEPPCRGLRIAARSARRATARPGSAAGRVMPTPRPTPRLRLVASRPGAERRPRARPPLRLVPPGEALRHRSLDAVRRLPETTPWDDEQSPAGASLVLIATVAAAGLAALAASIGRLLLELW